MADLSKQLRAMKRILILLLALMPVMASAQELDLAEGDVSYHNVFATTMTQDEIITQILAYDFLDDVVVHGNMIAGNIRPVYLDYEGAGYARMKVPIYLSQGTFSGRFVIRFKEGRYRVDVFNMYFTDTEGTMYGRTYLSDAVGQFAFDVTSKLVIDYLNTISQYRPWNDEW